MYILVGTFKIKEEEELLAVLEVAFDTGYRHIGNFYWKLFNGSYLFGILNGSQNYK